VGIGKEFFKEAAPVNELFIIFLPRKSSGFDPKAKPAKIISKSIYSGGGSYL
jgi:hypothetical protein